MESDDKQKIREAYNGYALSYMQRRKEGSTVAHDFIEKPAMYSKIPDVKGKSVLVIGCGHGDECKHLKALGAKRIVGIDLSEKMIELAQKENPDLEFYQMDMEELNFPEDIFDFVYSSLAMHYLKDWTKALLSVKKVLKREGNFLFSTHNPVMWSAKRTRTENERGSILGYVKYLKEDRCEVFGDYLNTRKITDLWYDEFEISYYHKSFSSIMKDIITSGFQVTDVLEPKALSEAKNKAKTFWEIREKIPLFIIFELQKV